MRRGSQNIFVRYFGDSGKKLNRLRPQFLSPLSFESGFSVPIFGGLVP